MTPQYIPRPFREHVPDPHRKTSEIRREVEFLRKLYSDQAARDRKAIIAGRTVIIAALVALVAIPALVAFISKFLLP